MLSLLCCITCGPYGKHRLTNYLHCHTIVLTLSHHCHTIVLTLSYHCTDNARLTLELMASCRASMTSSTWAISRLVSPARPTSLAMNLQIAMDWKILSPVDQVRQGSWPHVMLGFRSSQGLESSQGRLILESSNWRPPYASEPQSLLSLFWCPVLIT